MALSGGGIFWVALSDERDDHAAMKKKQPKPTDVLDVLLRVPGIDRRLLFGTLKELRRLDMWPQGRLTGKTEHEIPDERHCVRLLLALLGAEKIVAIEEAVAVLEVLPLKRTANVPKTGQMTLHAVNDGTTLGGFLYDALSAARRGEGHHIAGVGVYQGPPWLAVVQLESVDLAIPALSFEAGAKPELLFQRTRRIDGQVLGMLAEYLGPIEDTGIIEHDGG